MNNGRCVNCPNGGTTNGYTNGGITTVICQAAHHPRIRPGHIARRLIARMLNKNNIAIPARFNILTL